MSLATSNRDGGRTNEAGHLRGVIKGIVGEVLTGLNVTQRGAGANLSVDVAIGDAVIPRSDDTYGHPAWNDAVYNQAIPTADVTNPRRDIVVMYVDYGQAPSTGVSNNTNGVVKIKVVSGAAAGSPVDPSDAAIQSSVGAGNPFIKLARVRVAAGATSIGNSVIDDMRTMAIARENGGWQSRPSGWDHWQYSAWDNTNKLATILVPDSSIFTLGQKARYWQTTGGWKYGFIVAKPNSTSIIVYQGHGTGGFTLNNERIYLPAYSRDTAPDNFPREPQIWTVEVKNTSQLLQAAPVLNQWYNMGAVSLTLPIGSWNVEYICVHGSDRGVAGRTDTQSTLSTSNSTVSDTDFNSAQGGANFIFSATPHTKRKAITVAANTPYYLLVRSTASGANNIYLLGDTAWGTTILRAVCAYL